MNMKMGRDNALSANFSKGKQSIQILLANPLFQKRVQWLRGVWRVGEGNPEREGQLKLLRWRPLWDYGFWKLPESAKSKEDKAAFQAGRKYYKDLISLVAQFQLDKAYWLLILWEYVLTGNSNHEDLQSEIASLDTLPLLDVRRVENTKKSKIIIELGDKTTLKDIKAIWHKVEEWRDRFSPQRRKFKEWKNFDRDGKVYLLYEQGKTIAEISTRLLKEDGVDLDYGNIKKIVTTYRKKLGLPKGNKLITSSIKVNRRKLR